MSRMPGAYSQALSGLESLERRVGGAIGSYFIDGVAGGALLVVSQMPEGSHDMWPGPSQRMLLGLTHASVCRALGACVEGVGNGALPVGYMLLAQMVQQMHGTWVLQKRNIDRR